MTWSDLCDRASTSAAQLQWLLDRAWAAANAAYEGAQDAVMADELPTAFELCAALDARGVKVSDEVMAKFRGYLAPGRFVRIGRTSN
jgi:hypothetical protein